MYIFNSFAIYAILLNKDFNFLKRFDTGEQTECNLIKRNIFTSIKHCKQLNERVLFS